MSGNVAVRSGAVLTLAAVCAFARVAEAQDTTAREAREPAPIFTSETPLEFSIRANYRALHRSRAQRSGLHPAVITYAADGTARELPLQVRSRGRYRLRNCELPPLRLQFNRQTVRDTPFAGVQRGRLVMHCRDTDEYDDYVLREYQIYRMLNVLTPFSHRARLARVTHVDSASGRNLATRYAFLLEDDAAMARRNSGRLLVQQRARAGDLDPFQDALVGVLQYMIGNVDWSVAFLHNVLLVSTDAGVYAVVYDFDFTGAVNTRYARPDYQLPIRSVRQRLMRGYCVPREEFERVFALFNEKRDELYALYRDDIGQLMPPATVRETLAYYDEFYNIINDPRTANNRVMRACLTAQ